MNSVHGRHFVLVADGRLRASDKITGRGEVVGEWCHQNCAWIPTTWCPNSRAAKVAKVVTSVVQGLGKLNSLIRLLCRPQTGFQ